MDNSTFEILTTVANWIAAIANVTLFIIGFRTLRSDRQRIIKMELNDRQKYAENVYAWIEERKIDKVEVFCRNGSKSAIYEVKVALINNLGSLLSQVYEIELMKPLEELRFYINQVPNGDVCSVIVVFRDTSGIFWKRDGNGRLLEISNNTLNLHENNLIFEEEKKVIVKEQLSESKRRTIVKTIVWRIIGVIWTFLGVYLIILFIPDKYTTALILTTLITAYHHSTRMILYYFYERIWLKIKWGITNTNLKPMSGIELFIWIISISIILTLLLYFLIYINPQIEPKK